MTTVTGRTSNDFLNQLYEEKEGYKQRRHEFVKQKIAFITALLGLANIRLFEIAFDPLFYFVPFVALTFDTYIISEHFKVRRVGIFIKTRQENVCSIEQEWEKWLVGKREKSAAKASFLLSFIATGVATALLWVKTDASLPNPLVFTAWMIGVVWYFVGRYKDYLSLKEKLEPGDEYREKVLGSFMKEYLEEKKVLGPRNMFIIRFRVNYKNRNDKLILKEELKQNLNQIIGEVRQQNERTSFDDPIVRSKHHQKCFEITWIANRKSKGFLVRPRKGLKKCYMSLKEKLPTYEVTEPISIKVKARIFHESRFFLFSKYSRFKPKNM